MDSRPAAWLKMDGTSKTPTEILFGRRAAEAVDMQLLVDKEGTSGFPTLVAPVEQPVVTTRLFPCGEVARPGRSLVSVVVVQYSW